MQHKLYKFHVRAFPWRTVVSEEMVALLLAVFVFVFPASAAHRFQERMLYMHRQEPGVTTTYDVSFRYMSPDTVGSIDMLFCVNPIPYEPCEVPAGLDVSGAALADQTGETGYTISERSVNHLVLSRAPAPTSYTGVSSYSLSNIVNPTDIAKSFSIRLRSHATTNATGPQIDFGSVKGQVTDGIVLETQVPPMLIFCLARDVSPSCAIVSDVNYTEMGELTSDTTLVAQSQMAVGTNATGGFSIIASGAPPAAGTSVIDAMAERSFSQQGINQFGINLVANDDPYVGLDPEGIWANAVASPDYSIPNQYKFVSGDEVAYSPNVSLMKVFTVSYILNSDDDLRPGVYTTTISFIASGRF